MNNRSAHVDTEFRDLDDTIVLEHVEEHHEEVDYSNVPTLRVSDREYNNSTLQRKDLSGGIDGPMNGECPKEEYEYSTIKKELQDEGNKKRESFDPTYDTTKAPDKARTGSVMNSTYDTADFGEPFDEQYKNIGHVTNQESDKITEGLSGF